MNPEKLEKLISEALIVEAEGAKQAGALGYMSKCMIQASLPYKNPGDVAAWGRENGGFSLVIQPGYTIKNGKPNSIGFPYGNIPRLLLAWLTTEAVKTKKPVLLLGYSLSEFMRQLDLSPTGGKWGSITRIKEQTKKLFSAQISCTYDAGDGFSFQSIHIADKTMLWWEPKNANQSTLWQSTIELNPTFFEAITKNPVPIDMRALKALKHSPMALDIYCWLTYRMSYLRTITKPIPWELLQRQFGTEYAETPQGKQGFKRNFLKQLKAVYVVYPELKAECLDLGLVLKPSKPHIPILSLEKVC